MKKKYTIEFEVDPSAEDLEAWLNFSAPDISEKIIEYVYKYEKFRDVFLKLLENNETDVIIGLMKIGLEDIYKSFVKKGVMVERES
jgi:hypothetical protein